MKVVVYCTQSSVGVLKYLSDLTAIPSLNEQWKRIRSHYPGYEFAIVATEGEATHLVDYDENKKEIAPEGVKLVLLPRTADSDTYLETIRKEAPSIAIAASFYGGAVDWETLRDALIAEELRSVGVRVVCNSMLAAETFFDKWATHRVLTEKGFPVAKATHIPAIYQMIARENPEVFSNVYLDLAFHRIRQMQFPVIIKAAGGSGSSGVFVAEDFETAKEKILDWEYSTDLIIEEILKGEQFGTEIHGTKGNYTILPPFKCKQNEQGITDPKDNIKFGPITDEKYKVEELRSMLRRLAQEMGIEGCAQVDLAFDGDKWSIIEVNPRISGMTAATAALESRYVLEVVIESCLEDKINYDEPKILEKCMFLRTRIKSEEELYAMQKEVHIKYIERSTLDIGRADIRIPGAAIILGGFATFKELAEEVKRLSVKYPGVIFENVVDYVQKFADEQE